MCKSKHYIPTFAEGISYSKTFHDTRKAASDCKTKIDKLKMMKEKYMNDIKTSRAYALTRINLMREKMILYIEELAEKTKINITIRYDEVEETIRASLDKITSMADALDKVEDQLQKCINNETKLFVHLKQSKQILTSAEQLNLELAVDQRMPTFEIDGGLESFLKSHDCLGSFIDSPVYTAERVSDNNIKSSHDTQCCRISGMCSLADGGLVIVDHNNDCIKSLDRTFRMQARRHIFGKPYDVCQTSSNELAVTTYQKKTVQFTSLDQTMALTRSFALVGNGCCTGITYHDGKLFVCKEKPGSMQIYDMVGTLLQTVQGNHTRIENALHICLGTCSSSLYIADMKKGVITLNIFGSLLALTTDPNLKGVFGVCLLPGDQMLACGIDSNNVMQFDAKGKKIKTLLTGADGIKNPETLHVDTNNSRLIIGMYGSDVIKVYRLTRN